MFFTKILLAGAVLAPTSAADTLETTTVSADRFIQVSRIDTVSLGTRLSTDSFSNLLQRIPGLQINDYGGPAGIQNISIRGMGCTHVAVMVDGVRIGSAQNGQVDLGMLSMDGFDAVSVDYAGQRVNLISSKPKFGIGRKFAANASVTGGSFGTFVPSARMQFRLGKRSALSLNASAYQTSGDFRYRPASGSTAWASTDGGSMAEASTPAYLTRENNDIGRVNASADYFHELKDNSGDWHLKAYANYSDRGCPGSLSWPSSDRQTDRDGFVQGLFRRNVSDVYSIRASAKAAKDYMKYVSETYSNNYDLTEYQVNSSHDFRMTDRLSAVVDADVNWARLISETCNAERLGGDFRAAFILNTRKFKSEASIRYTGATDDADVRYGCLEPFLSARWEAARWLDVTATGRRSYRIPTFNDLYYEGMGNPDLKPEDAWMSEIGADMHKTTVWGWTVGAGFDIFWNQLSNKIISAPTDDPYLWSMFNLGEAQVYGADLSASMKYDGGKNLAFALSGKYTYQSGTAIPYQPVHKAFIGADLGWKSWKAVVNWNVHGVARDAYDVQMKAWNTLDVTVQKSFRNLILKLAGRNILNRGYEIVSGYPMPGAAVLGGVTVTLQ